MTIEYIDQMIQDYPNFVYTQKNDKRCKCWDAFEIVVLIFLNIICNSKMYNKLLNY